MLTCEHCGLTGPDVIEKRHRSIIGETFVLCADGASCLVRQGWRADRGTLLRTRGAVEGERKAAVS